MVVIWPPAIVDRPEAVRTDAERAESTSEAVFRQGGKYLTLVGSLEGEIEVGCGVEIGLANPHGMERRRIEVGGRERLADAGEMSKFDATGHRLVDEPGDLSRLWGAQHEVDPHRRSQ